MRSPSLGRDLFSSEGCAWMTGRGVLLKVLMRNYGIVGGAENYGEKSKESEVGASGFWLGPLIQFYPSLLHGCTSRSGVEVAPPKLSAESK
jgi:hypothetical protein